MVIPKATGGYSKRGRWVFAQAPNYTGYACNNDAPTTLPLATERFNDIGCVLTSNQLTGLTAGEYYYKSLASVVSTSANALYGFSYLWNFTDSAVLGAGVDKGPGANAPSAIEGTFVLSGTKTIELRGLFIAITSADPSVRRKFNTEGPSNTTAGLDELIWLELYKK